jgi:hypothetical protein
MISPLNGLSLPCCRHTHFQDSFKVADATLLHMYAQYFPVFRMTGGSGFGPEPLWNLIPCGTCINPGHPQTSGLHCNNDASHHCWFVGIEAELGHLGYLVVNDDAIIQ